MGVSEEAGQVLAAKVAAIFPHLDERQRRLACRRPPSLPWSASGRRRSTGASARSASFWNRPDTPSNPARTGSPAWTTFTIWPPQKESPSPQTSRRRVNDLQALTARACCQAVCMDRAEMATTVRSTGNRPGQPLTRNLRCVLDVPSAPLSPRGSPLCDCRMGRYADDQIGLGDNGHHEGGPDDRTGKAQPGP
jgi:hypothetical protein